MLKKIALFILIVGAPLATYRAWRALSEEK